MKATHLFAAAMLAVTLGTHAQTPAASAPMTDGEVRKVDKAQGKLTLRHGPIQNLDMPGMTMVFKVADPKLLDKVKEGDKIRFAAERTGGAITVTAIEPAAK
ncbi:MAG TPA: copper-binding protein [Ideonella sp.]|jgi:Cu/Ag efflux protein CusF|nr:copper-binding protein [Ideonella sp.]